MDIKSLYSEIKKICKQIFKEEGIALFRVAKVISYTAPNATVLVAGYSTNITIPNKSNVALVANDQVVCVILNNDMSNMFVGWKM